MPDNTLPPPPPSRGRAPRWVRRFGWRVTTPLAVVLALAIVGVGHAASVGPFAGRPADTTTPTPGASTSASPSGSASPNAGDDPAFAPGATQLDNVEIGGSGGPHNQVKVTNKDDNKLRARGHIQLNRITGPSAHPLNEADALAQCTGCTTLAVAMQVNLIAQTTHDIQPQNLSVALNYQCQSCVTIALAYQFNITLPDPKNVPDRVKQLVKDMNKELDHLAGSQATPASAENEVEAVIDQYQDLTASLTQLKKQSTAVTDPDATPVAPDSASPSPSPSAAPSSSASPSGTATPSSTTTPTPTPTPTGSSGPSPSPSASTSPSPT